MASNAQTKERPKYSRKVLQRIEKLRNGPLRYHCMTKTSIHLGEEEFRPFKDKELEKKIKELEKYLFEQNYGMLRYIVIETEQRREGYGFAKIA